MTEEIKISEDTKKTCDCREKAIAKIKEFLFIAGAVFVGGTLSILLSANLVKPKYPMGPMGPRPAMHRQLPPPMMHGKFDKGFMNKRCKCHHKQFRKHHRGDFNKQFGSKAPVKTENTATK